MSPKTNEFGDVEIETKGQANEFGDMPIEDNGSKKEEKKRTPEGWASRTGRAAWEWTGKPVMDIMGGASRDPARAKKAQETATGFLQGIAAEPGRVWGELSRSGEAMVRGDVPGAAYHLGGAVPFLGAPAQQITQEVAAGKGPEAIGHAGAFFAPAAAELLPSRFGPIVRKVTTPPLETALTELERPSTTTSTGATVPRTPVPMSTGQRSGQLGLQRTEQVTLPNLPGSAIRAHRAQAATEGALAQRGGEIARAVSGTRTDPFGAGEGFLGTQGGTQGRLAQRITRLKGRADALYNSVRQDVAANTQAVQVGTQTSPILGPRGQPITTPVMQTFETPISLAPIRSGLRYVYDELERSLSNAQKQYSPAWSSLKELMTTDRTTMNALDFDKSLSALKAITRDGTSNVLNNQAQRLAKQMIAEGEAEFQKVIKGAGPNTLTKLKQARDAVRAYHKTADLLAELPEKPTQLYEKLTQGEDKSLGLLQELQKIAPNETRVVARTYLEQMLKKATSKGGFERGAGVRADWQSLGDRTKQLLYGKDLTNEVTNFVHGAEHLTKPLNPSGSMHGYVAFGGTLYAAWEVAKLLAAGNYKGAALWAAGSVAVPNLAARLLLSPGGKNWLMNSHKILSLRGPARATALSSIAATLAEDQRKESAESPWQVPPVPAHQ